MFKRGDLVVRTKRGYWGVWTDVCFKYSLDPMAVYTVSYCSRNNNLCVEGMSEIWYGGNFERVQIGPVNLDNFM